MELEDKDERTFEDFLAFLQLHPELKTWEIGPEPILSLPGLQIYPDRRKIYHGQQEIELNMVDCENHLADCKKGGDAGAYRIRTIMSFPSPFI